MYATFNQEQVLRCQQSDKVLFGNNWSFLGLEYFSQPDSCTVTAADGTQMLCKQSDVMP